MAQDSEGQRKRLAPLCGMFLARKERPCKSGERLVSVSSFRPPLPSGYSAAVPIGRRPLREPYSTPTPRGWSSIRAVAINSMVMALARRRTTGSGSQPARRAGRVAASGRAIPPLRRPYQRLAVLLRVRASGHDATSPASSASAPISIVVSAEAARRSQAGVLAHGAPTVDRSHPVKTTR
jgi:hypothetical protein